MEGWGFTWEIEKRLFEILVEKLSFRFVLRVDLFLQPLLRAGGIEGERGAAVTKERVEEWFHSAAGAELGFGVGLLPSQ